MAMSKGLAVKTLKFHYDFANTMQKETLKLKLSHVECIVCVVEEELKLDKPSYVGTSYALSLFSLHSFCCCLYIYFTRRTVQKFQIHSALFCSSSLCTWVYGALLVCGMLICFHTNAVSCFVCALYLHTFKAVANIWAHTSSVFFYDTDAGYVNLRLCVSIFTSSSNQTQ